MSIMIPIPAGAQIKQEQRPCPDPPCAGSLCPHCTATVINATPEPVTTVYVNCKTLYDIYLQFRNPQLPKEVRLYYSELFNKDAVQYISNNGKKNIAIPSHSSTN